MRSPRVSVIPEFRRPWQRVRPAPPLIKRARLAVGRAPKVAPADAGHRRPGIQGREAQVARDNMGLPPIDRGFSRCDNGIRATLAPLSAATLATVAWAFRTAGSHGGKRGLCARRLPKRATTTFAGYV